MVIGTMTDREDRKSQPVVEYDMTPMAFAPRSGGGLPDTIPEANIHASVANKTWQTAEQLARSFLARIIVTTEFSHRFEPCISALKHHIATASAKIERLK